MSLRRPAKTLILFLASALGSPLRANPVTIVGKHAANPAQTTSPRDGNDLPFTIDKLTDLSLHSGMLGIYLGKLYMGRVSKAARYPAACENQLSTMLLLSALALPITDKDGKVVAEFDDKNRLHLRNHALLKNQCAAGISDLSLDALLTARGFVIFIEEILGVKTDPDKYARDAFYGYVGYNIMTEAEAMPACKQDLEQAVRDISNLYYKSDSLDSSVIALQRDAIIRRIAEKAFRKDDECNIGYNIGSLPATPAAKIILPSLP